MSDALIARLPHGPRARWIRRVVTIEADTIVGEGGAPAGCALVREGRLPVFAALELCAQTAALLEIAAADAEMPVATRGYVVRARRVRLQQAWIAADLPMRAMVRRAGAAPPLHTYSVSVTAGGLPLLTGSIATYVPGDAAP